MAPRKAPKTAASVVDEEVVGRFWMVYGIGKNTPTHRHETKQLAIGEAKRLAEACPGHRFVVMQAVDAYCARIAPPAALKVVTAPPPRPTDDEIPF